MSSKPKLKDIKPLDLLGVGLRGKTVILYLYAKPPVMFPYKHLRSAKASMAKWVWHMRKELDGGKLQAMFLPETRDTTQATRILTWEQLVERTKKR